MESKDPNLRLFFNMLEKLINPNGIGNKHISSLRKDIAIFLDHSDTSD
ncbi:4721_t:CDS:2 [Funneliformis geosporum]|uniref:4721_t:CDS:1 n=1 Tax=Funneliformis geosporum TaxID=1117311 RepID=A0A9W4T9E5_9GLOM|nr:4721_t:CDS:2 [Funneliformis geosporum]